MQSLQDFKCPCCGGSIEWNSSSQSMKCPYCDSEFDMESLNAANEAAMAEQPDDIKWDVTPGEQWTGGEAEGMLVYSCEHCGAEIVADTTTAASTCPYCDNNIVMRGNIMGDLKPDMIIPFKIDKKAAKEGLKNHLKGKKLLPRVFKDENHIDEIKGIYVPFWLYDADAGANIRYLGTKVKRWSDSNYNYKRTSFYQIMRSGTVSFREIPADGSSKMDDALMDSIEPFNTKDAVAFNPGYLSGYVADKYDVSAEDNIGRANARVKKSTEDAFKSTIMGYTTVTTQSSTVNTANGKAKYAMFPVWILNTTWKDKKYTFAMNGQTGKFVGNLPVCWSTAFKYWGAFFAGFTALATAISYFILMF